jgi:hypothetical protein
MSDDAVVDGETYEPPGTWPVSLKLPWLDDDGLVSMTLLVLWKASV